MGLHQIKGNTYCYDGAVNIGIYFLDKNSAILIDSGSDDSIGRKILRHFKDNQIELKAIINTHSHADHCGGNYFFQKRTNCKIYATEIEAGIINDPILEPIYLYSSSPIKELNNKFLRAQKSNVTDILEFGEMNIEGKTFKILDLQGHSPGMIGVTTDDNVTFIADSLFDEKVIDKHKVIYCMDLEGVYKALDKLNELSSDFYVLSHGGVKNNIDGLIKINREAHKAISNRILELLNISMTREELLEKILNHLELNINIGQYYLNNSVVSCHLAYLSNNNIISPKIKNNKLFWEKCIK